MKRRTPDYVVLEVSLPDGRRIVPEGGHLTPEQAEEIVAALPEETVQEVAGVLVELADRCARQAAQKKSAPAKRRATASRGRRR